MPDPHQDRGVGLEAGVWSIFDGYLGLGQFGVGVLVVDRAYLQHPDREGAVNLDVGGADSGSPICTSSLN